MRYSLKSLLASALIANSSITLAQTTGRSLAIEHPYASATPQGAKTADVYMTVLNKSQMPDRMITGATDVADALQIHEMAVVNGVFAPPCGDPSAAPPTSRGNLQFLLKGSDKLKPEP